MCIRDSLITEVITSGRMADIQRSAKCYKKISCNTPCPISHEGLFYKTKIRQYKLKITTFTTMNYEGSGEVYRARSLNRKVY